LINDESESNWIYWEKKKDLFLYLQWIHWCWKVLLDWNLF
jgi:hypothetical protein